jgi:hypothetical protein
MFDFDHDEEVTRGVDMILINGKVPDREICSFIILITCGLEDEAKLKEFIKKENGIIFVFEDEPSMDHFRRLFQGSINYLDETFSLTDLQYIGQSKENKIKFLKYISGIESFIDKRYSFSFLNESTYINTLKRMKNMKGDHIWILKDEEDEVEIEGFYIA